MVCTSQILSFHVIHEVQLLFTGAQNVKQNELDIFVKLVEKYSFSC